MRPVFTLTRHDNQQELRLPFNLMWSDEFLWSSTAQATPVRSITGKLLIQRGTRIAGRPITLKPDVFPAWMLMSDARRLRDWTDIPDLVMTLTHYDGREFDVVFRLHDDVMGNVQPIKFTTPEELNAKCVIEIRLMTI